MSTINIILRLYLPLLIFIVGIIGILCIRKADNAKINIPILGFISIPLPISNTIVAKCIFSILLILSTFFYYLLFDFSKMFPDQFQMIVHFNDKNEITKMIEDFGIKEIDGYRIEVKADTTLAKYFDLGDQEIRKIFQFENYYSDILFNDKSPVETNGTTTFKVKKISGIHNYRVVESNGELTHQKFNEQKNKTEFWKSKFTKISSANDLITINKLNQLFDKIVIAPKFNQSIIINGNEETKLEHTLYGVTYVTPLPYPKFSGTLYLFKKNDILIPVGYAKNYAE